MLLLRITELLIAVNNYYFEVFAVSIIMML